MIAPTTVPDTVEPVAPSQSIAVPAPATTLIDRKLSAVMAENRPEGIQSGVNGQVRAASSKEAPVVKRVVLAYSGGLDTSVIVNWLKENYNCEIICMTADIGQGDDELEGLEQKAMASGATAFVLKDLKAEFLAEYVFPCLRAGLIYEDQYLMGTAMARPLIAKAMVEVANEYGADAFAHGCTGKGNDQVRFDLGFMALSPDRQIIVPWRTWDIKGREDAIDYCVQRGIPIAATKEKIYSRDRNIWHLSHEGGVLEDPANVPEEDMYMMTCNPLSAPQIPEYVTIGMECGIPVSINGVKMNPVAMVTALNEAGGRHGVGRIDIVENRVVGIKSRGVYETPGGTILYAAARALERLTLTHAEQSSKHRIMLEYADLVYGGQWFSLQRESCEAFMVQMTSRNTGDVVVQLHMGRTTPVSTRSVNSMYRQDISSFEEGSGTYNQADAAGFIRLVGLPTMIRAMLDQERGQKPRGQ